MGVFDRIVMWCEFPQKVDWKELSRRLVEVQFSLEVYVACTSFENYKWWAREIRKQCPYIKEVNAWPVLAKRDGYWFSGFTSVECIDRLNEYKGAKIKIDLEPPFPGDDYSNARIARFLLGLLFRRGRNNGYLAKTISRISESNEVLVNEFPLPKWMLMRWGCYYPSRNKNVMCYTSLVKNGLLRKLLRWWNFHVATKRKASMCSIGLIHSGIFGNEPYYDSVKELVTDMEYAWKKGFKNVAVYSLDAMMRRRDAIAWLSALKEFS